MSAAYGRASVRAGACRRAPAMPNIEELPDDYEERAPPAQVKASSSGSGTLRRGFFSSSQTSKAAPSKAGATPNGESRTASNSGASCAASSQAAPTAAGAAPGTATGTESGAAREEAHADKKGSAVAVATPSTADGDADDFPSAETLVQELRAKLLSSASGVGGDDGTGSADGAANLAAGDAAVAGVQAAAASLAEVLAPLRAESLRWPTAQVRGARDRAAAEVDGALGEMRALSNDARRLRSGEEKRALAELKRVADDAHDRVRKIAEAAAPRANDSKDSDVEKTVAAFHALPVGAKLYLLARERSALALFGAAFLGGAGLACGLLLEVYSAWNCGMRCGA